MAENYDDISCEDVIYSEDYQDYIKEYFQDFSSIAGTYHPVCIEAIGSRYFIFSQITLSEFERFRCDDRCH